ncbi:hypothetical protein BDZ91DRAFT_799219 [Kalaharituber pfeilii]|nr:hypothetical protein BDZ91DRAFT_799219 [Kalaharituber pfeilii]
MDPIPGSVNGVQEVEVSDEYILYWGPLVNAEEPIRNRREATLPIVQTWRRIQGGAKGLLQPDKDFNLAELLDWAEKA